ncbi:asparagine synthase-related protein [Microbacterium sp. K24]|uniref:asparagine synthase-related protein n=1 Tax=Microbacterium sp. K24 TaxID=2305446 RepID=UPI00109C9D7B|nr:asparagine synthase-related protein [Microbacterium sp. K24]
MFFAVSMHPAGSTERVDRAAQLHARHLSETARFGELARREFAGGSLHWDGGSSHADITDAPDGSGFLLRGGYTAGDDGWNDGRHATEDPRTWGEFTAVRVRPTADGSTVDVWADRAGSWPLYYGSAGRHAVISNDPHFIAVALGITTLSAQGSYELLAYHHAIGRETTLSGVHALVAGEALQASTGDSGTSGPHLHRRSNLTYSRPTVSTDATYEALRDAVAQIGPLHDPDRTLTLQISGGLDSRLTLGVLAEAGPGRPEAVTLDLSTPEELEVAHHVATTLGFPHRTARLDEMSLQAARSGWSLTGGQVSVHAAAGNILAYEVSAKAANGDVTLVGAWPGDCLIGSYVPVMPLMVSRFSRGWALRDWSSKRAPIWRARGVAVTGPRAKGIARAADRSLRRSVLRSPGRSAAQSISAWAMFERQPRFSYVSPAILSHDVLAVTPVLAGPYLDALLTLSPTDIIAKNYYRRMIHSRLVALRDVPNANTGAPVSPEPVLPPRLPRSRPELFGLLPASIQEFVRRLRPANHYIGRPAPTAETEFWNSLFAAQGVEARVDLDGVTVDARESGDLHVGSVALALSWSRKYLEEAYAELGAVPTRSE